ncbi:hypothetical protein L204_103715 [Cryptococcus depauperatus]|nr:hypothetical protein L204_02031 [Cryptococcus depauperatus CBS 7855]
MQNSIPPSVPNPPPQPAPFTPTPTLLPGPFILLVLLPAIPLLLFSIGARPPDTSALPFSTNDLFVTTSLICFAFGAVLMLGVYPDVGGRLWLWIREGEGLDWDSSGAGGLMEGLGLGDWQWKSSTAGSRGETVQAVKSSVSRSAWVWDGRYRRWVPNPVPPPLVAKPVARVNSRALAYKHLTALREFRPRWYSTHKPELTLALVIIGFVIFISIVVLGNFLKSAYDSEATSNSSSSSNSRSGSSTLTPWVERELRKRKDEKSDETIKRVEKEEKAEEEQFKKKGNEELEKWRKKREKEKEVLKRELTKRKMPLADLEDNESQNNKDKSKKNGKGEKDKNNEKGEKDKNKKNNKNGDEQNGKTKVGIGTKVKTFLLGERAKSPNEEKNDGTWEPADAGVAEVTITNSTANAQREAERLKAGG